MRKSILVVGATGYLGGKVITHLISRNVKVSALVRPGTDAKALESKGVLIIRGDLTKPDSLTSALQDIDAVISTAIGYSNRKKGDSLKTVDDAGNRNLIDAMVKAKIKRFVFTSILTADKAIHVPHFHQKKLIEDYMDEKKLPYIAIRPGAFLDQTPKWDGYARSIKKGNIKVFGSALKKWTYILSDDAAKYLTMAALDETIPNGKIDVGMNEPMNAEMLAKYVYEYSGNAINVSILPWWFIGSILSFSGLFKSGAADLKKMFDFIFTGQYVADTTLQQKYFGDVPTVKDSVFRYCEQIGLLKKEQTQADN